VRRKSSNKKSRNRPRGNTGSLSAKTSVTFFQKPAGVWLLCALLFAITLWTFYPAVHGKFQYFDERGELILNQHINTGLTWNNFWWCFYSLEFSNWHPLNWISHLLDFKMFGRQPWGHHLTSVLLHAGNSILLFLALKRLTGALWNSLIVAALFALHPLRVESVAWISERKDVLSVFFGLIALWTYARYTEESRAPRGRLKLFYGLTLFFFACSLMSKSMLVTLPCVFLLLDYWPLRRISDFRPSNSDCVRLIIEKIPFFLLTIPVCIATSIAQKDGGQFLLIFPFGFRLETAFMGYARYLGKLFWPTNLSVLYPYPDHWPVGELVGAVVLVLGMSALVFLLHRRQPYLLVGWLLYLGTLVPVIGFIPLGGQSLANRYTYFPMIGVLLLVVWMIGEWSWRWRARNILVTAIVVVMASVFVARTRYEIGYWKDSETLWRQAVAVTQNNFMAHYNLAAVVSSRQSGEEIIEYQKSVDEFSEWEIAQRELGASYIRYGYYSNAIGPLEKAIQLNPNDGWACADLGMAFYNTKRASESIPWFMKAVEIDPALPNLKDKLNTALFSEDSNPDCISNFLVTARSDPVGFGKFLDTMEFDTNHVIMIKNLAAIFAISAYPELRNGNYSVRLAKRACEMTGYRTNVTVATLAVAYAANSQYDEAISNAELACLLTDKVGPTNNSQFYQGILRLFRAHQPYHE
jgi:uncharacterized membrane protein YqjE